MRVQIELTDNIQLICENDIVWIKLKELINGELHFIDECVPANVLRQAILRIT